MSFKDQRSLHRIPNHFGDDLKAHLYVGREVYPCKIRDYNSFSIALSVSENLTEQTLETLSVSAIKLLFGEEIISLVQNPVILKYDSNSSILVLLLQTSEKMITPSREYRTKIPEGLMGACFGADPIKMDQVVHFKIVDISPNGFLAASSKSNRHLLPGMAFKNFHFTLPGVGLTHLDFSITNSRIEGNFLYFGCEFKNLNEQSTKALDAYYFICANSTNPDAALKYAKSKKISFKNLVRIERVSDPETFKKILHVRYESYKYANKLSAKIESLEHMRDIYDDNSIILVGFLGSQVVGTIRIVFSDKGSKLPFEEHFDFPANLNRQDLVEVSKLAVLPQYQGSDVLLKMFQAFAFEYVPKKRYAICMSTRKLSKYYTSIGAQKISNPIPHPTLKDETLTCYLFDSKRLERGKMYGTTWYLFAKDTIASLSKYGFTKKVGFSARLSLKKALEQAVLKRKR